MRIKIKNPHAEANRQALIITGVLSLLILAAAVTISYLSGGPFAAWNNLGDTINNMCEDEFLCRLGFAFLFKLCPFLIPGLFVLGLWEKRTKFRSLRPGTYFTHITFGKDGVLLEKPNPAQNVFFPYGETSLDLSVTVHQITTNKGGQIMAVSNVKFTFTQTGGDCKTIELFPPRKVLPFLCKILDKRARYARFYYEVTPLKLSYRDNADQLRQKLDKYCQTGFMSMFNSPLDRMIALITGLILIAIGFLFPLSLYLEKKDVAVFYFCGVFLLFIPAGIGFSVWAVKDMYRERKSRQR